MAATRGQTHAKRDREIAQREKRERKRAKKAEASAQRAAGKMTAADGGGAPDTEERSQAAAPESIQ